MADLIPTNLKSFTPNRGLHWHSQTGALVIASLSSTSTPAGIRIIYLRGGTFSQCKEDWSRQWLAMRDYYVPWCFSSLSCATMLVQRRSTSSKWKEQVNLPPLTRKLTGMLQASHPLLQAPRVIVSSACTILPTRLCCILGARASRGWGQAGECPWSIQGCSPAVAHD